MTKGVWALLVSSTILVAPPLATAAEKRTVVGRVVDLRPETLVIKTKREGVVSISLGSRTRYLKWVTRKPWQQDIRADASFLRVGRLVAVEVSTSDKRLFARVVRIATE